MSSLVLDCFFPSVASDHIYFLHGKKRRHFSKYIFEFTFLGKLSQLKMNYNM